MLKLDNEVKLVIEMDDVVEFKKWISGHGPISQEVGYQLLKNIGMKDSVGCLEVLMEEGVDVEYRSPGRLPILSWMVLRESDECFKMLVGKGVYCEQTLGVLVMKDREDLLGMMLEGREMDDKMEEMLEGLLSVSLVFGKEKVRGMLEEMGVKYKKLDVKGIVKLVGSVGLDEEEIKGRCESWRKKVEEVKGMVKECEERKKEKRRELKKRVEKMVEEIVCKMEEEELGGILEELEGLKLKREWEKRKLGVLEKVYKELVC